MKRDFLITLFIFAFFSILQAQDKPAILIIDSEFSVFISNDKLIKEISIPRKFFHKTKDELLKKCTDSTRYYGGNCFKVTYFNKNHTISFKKTKDARSYIRGNIYALDTNEIQKIKASISIERNEALAVDSTRKSKKNKDSLKSFFEASFVFQLGGESKIGFFLPKINLVRKHRFKSINLYYGAELGLHAGFLSWYGSVSSLLGIEKGIFNLETSLSHFRTPTYSDGMDGIRGPFSQNLWNLKLGVQIKRVRLKVGTSFLLKEKIPSDQERIPLLDLGKIGGRIYGFEVQIK